MNGRTREAWMKEVAGAAVADWRRRHICLPSLVIAIFMVGEGRFLCDLGRNGKKTCVSIPPMVRSHNDYLATWTGEGQQEPNWGSLVGERHYILAVQYLQDAKYPYSRRKDYEERLVKVIEGEGLTRFDGG